MKQLTKSSSIMFPQCLKNSQDKQILTLCVDMVKEKLNYTIQNYKDFGIYHNKIINII